METLQPVIASERRAKSAITTIYITTIAFTINKLLSIINNMFSDDGTFFRYDFSIPWQEDVAEGSEMFFFVDFVALANSGYSLIFIASAIIFIMWFWRAYSNLHLLGTDRLYNKGWTIGSWFIPVLNFYFPYQIMRSMFDGLNRELMKNELVGKPTTRVSTSSLGTWWGLWIFLFFIGNIQMKGGWLFTSTMTMIIDMILVVAFFALASYTVQMIEEYVRAEKVLLQDEVDENRFSDIVS